VIPVELNIARVEGHSVQTVVGVWRSAAVQGVHTVRTSYSMRVNIVICVKGVVSVDVQSAATTSLSAIHGVIAGRISRAITSCVALGVGLRSVRQESV
jgi:hypothetical protein